MEELNLLSFGLGDSQEKDDLSLSISFLICGDGDPKHSYWG